MVCMKGIGPVDAVLSERIGDPSQRRSDIDSPMPPVPFVIHMTSRIVRAMCSKSSSVRMTKQLDSWPAGVPALTRVDPAAR